MDTLVARAAGIDIHKKTAVVCVRLTNADGSVERLTQTFGTMTADLLKLSAWLTSLEVTYVVMESTGEFWKPLYNLLEGSFELLVVNAQHVKHVPGRNPATTTATGPACGRSSAALQPLSHPPARQCAESKRSRQSQLLRHQPARRSLTSARTWLGDCVSVCVE